MSIFIIGGGTSAYQISAELRKNGFAEPITILSREPYLPYNRMNLPGFLRDEYNLSRVFFQTRDWYEENEIETFGRVSVEKREGGLIKISPRPVDNLLIDNQEYCISKQTTPEELNRLEVQLNQIASNTNSSDKIIWATSSEPFIPPIFEAVYQKQAFTWRTIDDTIKFKDLISKSKNIVLIGGSFIALELAMALQKFNKTAVWLVKTETFLRDGLDPKIQNQLINNWQMTKPAFKPHFLSEISEIKTLDTVSSNGLLEMQISTNLNTLLRADLILLGTGLGVGLKTRANSFNLSPNQMVAGDLLLAERADKALPPIRCGSFNQTTKTSRLLAQLLAKQVEPHTTDWDSIYNTPYQIKFANKLVRMSGGIGFPGSIYEVVEDDKQIKQDFYVQIEGRKVNVGTVGVFK
jgi:hypothetical protein